MSKRKRLFRKRNREWSIIREFKRKIKLKRQLHLMRLYYGEHR